jgi:uncharacterized protein DUF4238
MESAMEKSNHHYVPQHWMKRFRGEDGNLWVRSYDREHDRIKIGICDTATFMNSPYLYTCYDEAFNGSDALEDALAEIEGRQGAFLKIICNPSEPVGEGTRHDLAAVLALQVLRHPDVLAYGRRRAVELAEKILAIRSMSETEFMTKAAHLFDIAQPLMVYQEIHAKTLAEIAAEVEEIKSWSPQSPHLAETDSLGAFMRVCNSLHGFHMRLLDIRDNEGAYVLGDTPVPQDSLASGFTVPLSKRLAVAAFKAPPGERPAIERGFATVEEIAAINREQWDNHAEYIIGESPATLKALPPIDPTLS